ncbi:MAG TPA: heparan-alpha-glucosaminide N-acetyltransferase domain-containing protein [Candidatus Bathyarchaeia archaeon]|nr:heparan-alpha-glucosaminide N-acetyltransferase domain-containing protein [Candidatus Bathyarchaeia archaeon]
MDIREKVEENMPSDSPKRLVTLDILRGIAIFGVTLLHISYKLYNSNQLFENIQNGTGMPFYVWILIVILGYFGTWHGFFLFISAVVNSYTFTKKAFNDIDLKKILLKNTVAGLIVVALGYLVEGFGYFGYFGHALRSGEWNTFGAKEIPL